MNLFCSCFPLALEYLTYSIYMFATTRIIKFDILIYSERCKSLIKWISLHHVMKYTTKLVYNLTLLKIELGKQKKEKKRKTGLLKWLIHELYNQLI